MEPFVLVGGWPGSGKTTLANALARELRVPALSKDDVKEALMDALGRPRTVDDSRRLGRAAVHAVLRLARQCPGAVIDSTWYPYSLPLVRALPGSVVEVRCLVSRDLAEQRYRARRRDPRNLDSERNRDDLWAFPVEPLGVGPLLEVDTEGDVDAVSVACRVRTAVGGRGQTSDGRD